MSTKSGQVITVINDEPFKYIVQGVKNEGIDNQTGRRPLIYEFSCQNDGDNPSAHNFIVKVSSRMATFGLHKTPSPSTHQTAITFGLLSKQRAPEMSEFLLTTDSWASLMTESKMTGTKLKKAIQRLFYTVNMEWPEYGIGVPDLVDNFAADKETLGHWINALAKAGSLRELQFMNFWDPNGQVSMQTYALDQSPETLEHIKKELGDVEAGNSPDEASGPIRVFLSYSTKSKRLAGRVKAEIESYGMVAFLAHESIKPTEEWTSRILDELEQCDVFVPLLTEPFHHSKWTDQEAGMAMAFRKLICPMKIADDPYGFLGRFQAQLLNPDDVAPAVEKLIHVISNRDDLGRRLPTREIQEE